MNRSDLSRKYLRHNQIGLEIAGLHNPWPVPLGISIQLDLFETPHLIKQYPEMGSIPFVPVQLIDDATYLSSIASNSWDFVLSSHVLEHVENVALAIKNWLRVLKPHHFVLMAIPEKTMTFDREREETPISHIVTEYAKFDDYRVSNLERHYTEYYSIVDHYEGPELARIVQQSMITKPHIHFHCWNFKGIVELFERFKTEFNYKIHEIEFVNHEVFVVIEKL